MLSPGGAKDVVGPSSWVFFRPYGACAYRRGPTADAVGHLLSPLRGWFLRVRCVSVS